MASNWLTFPHNIPSDGQLCYVRTLNYSVTPFEAYYNETTQSFESIVNSIVYPCYFIFKWKPA
jgi:hypothetical protein